MVEPKEMIEYLQLLDMVDDLDELEIVDEEDAIREIDQSLLLLQQEDTALAEEKPAMVDEAYEKPFRISRTTDDTGVRTTNMSDGSKVVSGADGEFTYNANGALIKERTPRMMGIQVIKEIDPMTGAESVTTNYRGKTEDGVRINQTYPGDIRTSTDVAELIKNAISTKMSFEGMNLGVDRDKSGKATMSASFTGSSGKRLGAEGFTNLAKQFKTMDKKD